MKTRLFGYTIVVSKERFETETFLDTMYYKPSALQNKAIIKVLKKQFGKPAQWKGQKIPLVKAYRRYAEELSGITCSLKTAKENIESVPGAVFYD